MPLPTLKRGQSLCAFAYDAFSRLVSAAPASGTASLRVYDGWNPIAEYAGQELAKTYLWGMDLSGTMQSAGGVGGRPAVRQFDIQNSTFAIFYPTYDGNGNISEPERSGDGHSRSRVPAGRRSRQYPTPSGSVAAHYEYDPFGNDITPSNRAGIAHNAFAHRFSTKPVDLATGLYYYGYRFYDPLTGRWPSRDPIEEEGGYNLYGFVTNVGVGSVDILGLFGPVTWEQRKTSAIESARIAGGEDAAKRTEAIYSNAIDERKPLLADALPVVGTGKGVHDLTTGHDLVSGQQLTGFQKVMTGIGTGLSVIPVAGGAFKVIVRTTCRFRACCNGTKRAIEINRIATVFEHPGIPRLFSVAVQGGEHTHLVADRATKIASVMTASMDNPGPILRCTDVALDTLRAATKQQELLSMTNLRPFDPVNNSCVSHVCVGLESGGVKVPVPSGRNQYD